MINEEILKLARENNVYSATAFAGVEAFYHAAYRAGLEAAAKVCDERDTGFPEHHAGFFATAIRALKEMK